jgi:hypothetical protein
MLAHHHMMKNRDNISAVIEGLQGDHSLLAAYLESTEKIDRRALPMAVIQQRCPDFKKPIGSWSSTSRRRRSLASNYPQGWSPVPTG